MPTPKQNKERKIKGWLLVGSDKLTKGNPISWTESRKECKNGCIGRCMCDPSMYYYPVFLDRKEALRQGSYNLKAVPIVILFK